MHELWDSVIAPLLASLKPKVIVEIGAGKGALTARLLQALDDDAVLHVVEPEPRFDPAPWLERYGDRFVLHRHLSLNALPNIAEVDVAFVDGDHNWYTVLNELVLLDRRRLTDERPFPLVLLHETAWPYARRDRYQDPTRIPEAHRHAHRRLGVHPDTPELVPDGLAADFEHAVYQNDLENGVLTAIEDFVAERDDLRFVTLPVFKGLTLLATAELQQRDPVLAAIFADPKRYLVEHDILATQERARLLERIERESHSASEGRGADPAATPPAAERLTEPGALADPQELERLERTLEEERARRLSLVAKLEGERTRSARLREFLRRAQGHIEAVFASQRWRLGSKLGDAYLRLRLKALPDTGEDHLRRLWQEVAEWEARQRGPAAPAEELRSLFHDLVAHLAREADDREVPAALARSDAALRQALDRPEEEPATPLVSIVMPTWNRAELLPEAVQSVREQSYANWELLVCDDGSTDATEKVLSELGETRLRYLPLEKAGAAAARNRGLEAARGEILAYLDSDNLWHPLFLERMVAELVRHAGHYCAFANFVDVLFEEGKAARVALGGRNADYEALASRGFDYETLCERNYVDLNTFVHRRSLYDLLGGFDEELPRHQDWDLVLKYAYLREPAYVDAPLALYRRNAEWQQISDQERGAGWTRDRIGLRVAGYHAHGLPLRTVAHTPARPAVTILSWDVSRNHLSKAWNLAEALSPDWDVQLLGFRFFDEPIFPPYEGETPSFETTFLDGSDFPDFHHAMAKAVAQVRGDLVYAVKPQLPSLGTALLANYHFGKTIVLEANDLETDVISPGRYQEDESFSLRRVDPADPGLVRPWGPLWARIMESLAHELPALVTHNRNLADHFGSRAYQIRNLKDESVYDPAAYEREAIRAELGYGPDDFVILFGGLLRRHKGIFELVELCQKHPDERLELLFASSRRSSDEKRLRSEQGDRVRILPPQGRNEMARTNLAADLVVLWLDPDVRASHYQMPYKLTDALAMGVPVAANEISDLGRLGHEGYLHLVDYGDLEGLLRVIRQLRDPAEREARARSAERGRRLFLREFSYAAAQRNFALLAHRLRDAHGVLPQARRFAELYGAFWQHRGLLARGDGEEPAGAEQMTAAPAPR